jgi:outer membrane biogenesis lipoprotein LolB
MTRFATNLARIAALCAMALAACTAEAPSGASSEPAATSRNDRLNDVDRFPQARGTNSYMRQ